MPYYMAILNFMSLISKNSVPYIQQPQHLLENVLWTSQNQHTQSWIPRFSLANLICHNQSCLRSQLLHFTVLWLWSKTEKLSVILSSIGHTSPLEFMWLYLKNIFTIWLFTILFTAIIINCLDSSNSVLAGPFIELLQFIHNTVVLSDPFKGRSWHCLLFCPKYLTFNSKQLDISPKIKTEITKMGSKTLPSISLNLPPLTL